MSTESPTMEKSPSSAEPTPAGPREQYDQWRSLRTHSAESIMTVYKELFFAGFPCRTKTDPNSKESTRYIDSSIRPFPQSFVYDFFQKYGVLESFCYDENRGIGSVTFADGEAAEGCYLSANLSLVFPPIGGQDNDDNEEDDNENHHAPPTENGTKQGWAGPKPILIFLEFAQSLAFVNPTLLLHEELQPGELSRHLLRTFPRVERKFTSSAAEKVVMEWTREPKKGLDEDAPTGVTAEEVFGEEAVEGEQGGVEQEPKKKKSDAAAPAKTLSESGPTFPCAEIEVPELRQSLWRTLKPPGLTPSAGVRVTVLDLWFEYYLQYQVNKTQPSPERITNPAWVYAQRPSITQEIASVDPSEPAPKGGPNVAHRIMHDDSFHQICTLLCYKIKFKNDPSWASFMRDIFTPSVQQAVRKNLSNRTYKADQHLMELQQSLLGSLHRSDAEIEWLKLEITQAASNAVENIKFLRRVDLGEIDRETGKEHKAEVLQRIRATNKFRSSAIDDHFILFSDFSNFIDQYAASGSASGLLSICEDPTVFQQEKGHFGYSALHDTTSTFRVLWEIFWIPILVMVALISFILALNFRTFSS